METASSLDGRTARRLANRDRILDVALELVGKGEGGDVERLAAAAGVSVRSIYNHFPTARDLVAGMYERSIEQIRPMLTELPSRDTPFEARVTGWVDVWARVQETIAAVRWRALVAEEEHPELQPELAWLRKSHREEIQRAFPEITDKVRQSAAIALTDSMTWRALRKYQHLSIDAAKQVVAETIRRLAT